MKSQHNPKNERTLIMSTPLKPFEVSKAIDGSGWSVTLGKRTLATHATKKAAEADRDDREADRTAKAEARKSTKVETPAAPEVPVVESVDVESLTKVQRLAAAKAERLAVQAWRDGGEVGAQPATPVRDWMAAAPADKVNGKPKKQGVRSSVRTDEQEAIVKQMIVDGRGNGDSWKTIAAALTEAGLPTQGGGQWWFGSTRGYALRKGYVTA